MDMDDEPVALIADPAVPGSLDAAREVLDALDDRGRAATILEGRSIRDAVTGAEATRSHFFVVVGDDDSFRELQEVVLAGEPSEPPLIGIVATDEQSDVARTFGLPAADPARMAAHLTGGNHYELDAGRLTAIRPDGGETTVFFSQLAQVGLGARASRTVGRGKKGGSWSRFIGFWGAYLRSPAVPVTIRADRSSWEGEAYDVVIGNGNYFGGGLKLSPRSFPGDGVLDVVAWHGPRSDAYTMLPKVYRGEQLPSPHAKEMRAKIGLSIEAERPMPVHADGFQVGTTPVKVVVMPKAVRLKV